MPAKISNVEGRTVTVKLSGLLTQKELSAVQAETRHVIATARILSTNCRIRVLVLAEDFAGWEKGGQWTDFAFQEDHDDDIERMAIVGEEQWRDLTLLFTSKGLRPFPIEYFIPEQLAEARAWLGK
jgi:hypothetical protein